MKPMIPPRFRRVRRRKHGIVEAGKDDPDEQQRDEQANPEGPGVRDLLLRGAPAIADQAIDGHDRDEQHVAHREDLNQRVGAM